MNDTQKKPSPEKTGNPSKGKTNQQDKKGMKGKDKRQYHNDPKWYTNLDTHTQFRLVTGYPDALTPIDYASTQYRSVINTIRQVYIPSTGSERTARTQQVFDMLKAVRGLSGVLPYSIPDLMRYLDVTYYVVNEYYRLLAALRISNYFSLQKSPLLPNSVIDDIGFTDIVANKAQYIELLCTMHNFIKNSLPTMGTILFKIKDQWDSIIPDSNDVDFATWYMYITDHIAYLPSGESSVLNLSPCLTIDEDAEFSALYESQPAVNNYATAMANWQTIAETISLNNTFSAIRGDMLGAFGPSVVLDLDLQYSRNIFGKYNELALMKIHNTEFAYMDTLILDPSNGIFTTSSSQSIQFNPSYDSVSETAVSLTVVYQSFAEFKTPVLIAPHIPGTKSDGAVTLQATGVPIKLDPCNMVFDAHKPDLNEGESLELADAKVAFSKITRISATALMFDISGFSDYIPFYMQSNHFVMQVSENGVTDTRTGTKKLCSGAYHTFGTLAVNELTAFREVMVLLSQSDWSPRIDFTMNHTQTGVVTGLSLWDTNILSSLSPDAYRAALRYIKYSLYSGNVSIGSKRFDNLVSVFNSVK